ncbi:hypothetical protein Tco_1545014, partial [Tanacetum coccineum]
IGQQSWKWFCIGRVAAETFITLWDPEKNVLLVVIGSARE